jgi:predicted O-linked N-acetylglucosamine transferase (SPINDLY family)
VHRLRQDVIEPALALPEGSQPPAMFPFLSMPCDISPAEMLRLARKRAAWVEIQVPPAMRFNAQKQDTRNRRLRIGYVSADFWNHPTAHLLAGVFEQHDHDQFEVHLYSFGQDDGSEYRRRCERATPHFHELRGKSAAEIAKQIHADGIDVLIDLMGYTAGAKPEIFAMRPAPVQVSYLGYLGTMGASFIDYIIADEIVVPKAMHPFYAEQVLWMPGCYQANSGLPAKSPRVTTRADWGLPPSGTVYACFNGAYKLDPMTFAQWMERLKADAGSVLWLVESGPTVTANLRAFAKVHGVDPNRLIFTPRIDRSDHLERMRHMDLFLDTTYYNAGATATDLVLSGMKLETKPGVHFPARMARSMLSRMSIAIDGENAKYRDSRKLESEFLKIINS